MFKFNLKTADFVPDFEGNRDLDPKDQIVIKIKVPSYSEKDLVNWEDSEEGSYNAKYGISVFENFVLEVKNVFGEDDKPIENPNDLLNLPGATKLISEVLVAFSKLAIGMTLDPLEIYSPQK